MSALRFEPLPTCQHIAPMCPRRVGVDDCDRPEGEECQFDEAADVQAQTEIRLGRTAEVDYDWSVKPIDFRGPDEEDALIEGNAT